jgi:arylsulfatase A-like enzyme
MPTVNSGPPFIYVENYRPVGWDPNDPFVRGKMSVTQQWPEKGGYNAIGGAEKAHMNYRDDTVGITFAEKAVKWINDRQTEDKNKPFFLYMATTHIHHPFTPSKRFRGTSQCGLYGDFIHELDWMVGEVLKVLDDHGIADKTMILFTSDNGGMLNKTGQEAWKAGHRLNGKLQGFKFGAWEGGHRVPFVVRWPGKIPAGTTSDALVSQIDLLATIAEIVGQPLPEDVELDSISQLAEFAGTTKEPLRMELMITPNSPKHLTVRKGHWVYIPSKDEGGFQGKKVGDHLLGGAATQPLTKMVNSDVESGKIKVDAPPAQLYNLKDDPYQQVNVYKQHPEKVSEMDAVLKKWRGKIPQTQRLGWINLKQK